jgi:hypothetical protein
VSGYALQSGSIANLLRSQSRYEKPSTGGLLDGPLTGIVSIVGYNDATLCTCNTYDINGRTVSKKGITFGSDGVPLGKKGVPLGGEDIPLGKKGIPLRGEDIPLGKKGIPLGTEGGTRFVQASNWW